MLRLLRMALCRCAVVLGTLAILAALCAMTPLTEVTKNPQRGESQDSTQKNHEILNSPVPCKGPRLIVHVGPHKTGTTALQEFLMNNRGWLRKKWGVAVGYTGGPKNAAYSMAIPLHNHVANSSRLNFSALPATIREAFEFLESAVNSSEVVVLSSEAFSTFTNETWGLFRSQLVTKSCLSAVVLHRDAPRWIAAVWSQKNKRTSNPTALPSEFAKLGNRTPDAHGDSDPQMQLLNTLKESFPHVAAASYDYLSEVNCSVAAFLVCNVSLGLTGREWARCRDLANDRSTTRSNKSPPHAAIDVVRLARTFYQLKLAARRSPKECQPWPSLNVSSAQEQNAHPETTATARNPLAAELAREIPWKCERLDGLFRSETERWFATSGAEKPRSKSRLGA
ncbi:unnamed protein product [Symbiodinium sp. CCMP2592]|nr:unnamed protein product [Symbiodinium sp. CCMP2592]